MSKVSPKLAFWRGTLHILIKRRKSIISAQAFHPSREPDEWRACFLLCEHPMSPEGREQIFQGLRADLNPDGRGKNQILNPFRRIQPKFPGFKERLTQIGNLQKPDAIFSGASLKAELEPFRNAFWLYFQT